MPAGMSDRTYFDPALPAFGVRIRHSGTKTYVVQYKTAAGQNRRLVLGAVGTLDLSKARKLARDALAKIRLNQDPVGEKLAARDQGRETFGALLSAYLAMKRSKLKPRSMVEVDRFLSVYAKSMHNRPVTGIDRRAVAIELARIASKHGPVASNRFRAALGAFFTWLAREGIVENNPVLNTNKAPESGARARVLSDAELGAIWRGVDDDQYGAIVRLLILTGMRRDEVGSLRWSEVDLNNTVIVLSPERTKNRRPHSVPLTPAVLEILGKQPRRQSGREARDQIFGFGQRGYSGWAKSQSELNARLEEAGTPIENWWLHDFRRSMSTTMHERLGIQPHIVEAVLGHVSGHRSGVAGTYNRSAYDVQKRHALTAWADHIAALVSGEAPAPNVAELAQYRK